MKILVTGGAGFIGRWVTKQLIDDGHDIVVLDNLSNGSKENIKEFMDQSLIDFIEGDIKDVELIKSLASKKFDVCYHLAASINVQDSIDDPKETFDNDVIGTFNILEMCKTSKTKVVFMSTCMVYDKATSEKGISEVDPVKPASPYAGSKISGEAMTLSYYFAYGLPTVVIRPFNTYGPYQKTGGEGGVVPIFIHKALQDDDLKIYGDGSQTRDLLYVTDCANFVVQAGYSNRVNGEIVNAGLGRDVSINDLAKMIAEDENQIKHITHIHPQAEIQKLLCNNDKAKELLGWQPLVTLEEGIAKTKAFIESH